MAKVDLRVQKAIEQVVRERFADATVLRVDISRDRDFDGDSIFNIFVVVDDRSRVRPTAMTSLIRHIRNSLGRIDESAFPIVRAMTKRDSEAILNGSR